MKVFRIQNVVLLLISSLFCHAWPQANNEKILLKNTHQLIYDGLRSGEGYFSADGKKLVFQSERETNNPFFQIYLLDLETGNMNRVSSGDGKTTCAFIRPDNLRILFASTHLDPKSGEKQKEEFELRNSGNQRRYSWDYDTSMDIFVADPDGENIRRLTYSKGYDAEASYSPDGSKIVFCSLRDAYKGDLNDDEKKQLEMAPSYFGEIYIMNANGSNQVRLTNVPGYDGGPFFSPDGQSILWRRFEENGHIADVYTMNLDGSDVQKMTDFKAMSWAPYYHPSAEYVLFASNKQGFANFEIFMVDANGKHEPVRVTNTDGFDGLPVFSPDGNKLCWTSNRTPDKKAQLFMANWNHKAALDLLAKSPLRNVSTNSKNGFTSQIDSSDFKKIVGYLASDELEGRMSGTEGTKKAAKYIIDYFNAAGLKPLNQDGGFRHKFEFTSGAKLIEGANSFEVIGKETTNYSVEEDFLPLSFSENGKIEGEVVFAGYGLSIPGEQGDGLDSYVGLDVKDKIVLVLRYVPEDVEIKRRQKLNRYSGLRYKALIAREKGAKALLVVSGPNSAKSGKLVPLNFDKNSANSGITVISISRKVANSLFKLAGKDLKETQTGLDKENPHFEGKFEIPDVKIKLSIGVEKIKKQDFNVIGVLKAKDNPDNETVIIGAHYDHLGYGETGSMAGKGEEGKIHNGADDNASGTSVVLELAAYFAENVQELKRDIVFALWSGEEIGIVGSSIFVESGEIPHEKIMAYINFDMVGRLNDNNLIIQGAGSSSTWKKMIEKRNIPAGFNLTIQDDPFQPTDITAFYPKKIPVLSFFTGSHGDYHRPSDDAETLNYEGLERIAKFAGLLIADVATMEKGPDYVKVERVKGRGGSRESMRAYLGTIPDYAGDGENGLKISGVSGNGPADRAGLKGGDVLIELGGQEVKNIYDYTFAIDALKIGQEVDIIVLRNGEKVVLKITPEARN